MESALKPHSPALPVLLLRARLALRSFGPVACAAVLLAALALGLLLWLVPQRALQAQRHGASMAAATQAPRVILPALPVADQNLKAFYAALGQKRHAEQEVRMLFGLAEKTGLTLGQGEYQDRYDQAAGVHAYQVTLPLEGSYNAVWNFSLLALNAMPYASLDEISFKREAVGNPALQARVRLTLYLNGAAPGAAP
jgi:hypothetical protein